MNNKTKKISNILSLHKLLPSFRRFSLLHFLVLTFVTIQTYFLNTLLMNLTDNDINIVAKDNVMTWCFGAIFMMIAVFVIKKTSLRISFVISVIIYIIMYIFFLTFMDEIDKYYVIVAILFSAGAGFYWIGFSYAMTNFNTENTKHIALAWVGIIATAVNLIMPYVSGYIITQFKKIKGFNEIAGYYVVFVIALIFAIFAIIVALTISKTPNKNKKTRFKLAFKKIYNSKVLVYSISGEFARAMREGTFMFILVAFLFELKNDEYILGKTILITSIIAFVAQWSSAKIVYKFKYHQIINFSTVALITTNIILILNYSPITIILFNILNGFFSVYLVNPSLNIYFNSVKKADPDEELNFEIFSIREYALAIGRTLGVIIVFLFPKTPTGYAMGMIILTTSQFLMSYLMSKAKKMCYK